VTKLSAAKLSPKSIVNYTQLMKMVVASAVDENTGDQLFPIKWNHDFADMPVVGKQHQPSLTEDEMTKIVTSASGREQVLYVLIAATGLRIGEALGLEITIFLTIAPCSQWSNLCSPGRLSLRRHSRPFVSWMFRDCRFTAEGVRIGSQRRICFCDSQWSRHSAVQHSPTETSPLVARSQDHASRVPQLQALSHNVAP
jgi:hypothetical protein